MKKLPIVLENQFESECWTYYKTAIIETISEADLWFCTHMNYYVADDMLGRFGDFGEQYGMEYYDSILKFNRVPVSETPPNFLKARLVNEIDKGNYVIVFLDFGKIFHTEESVHETLVYGYNDSGFICPILRGGHFIESVISYQEFEDAYRKMHEKYLLNGWNLLCKRNLFYGITSITPITNYQNDNILYGFIQKLRKELKGCKINLEKLAYISSENCTKTYYQGSSALLFFSEVFENHIKYDWNERKLYRITAALKTAYEHRKLLLRNMEYIQKHIGATHDPSVCEAINSYREAITNFQRGYLLAYKYRYKRDNRILSCIGNLCLQQYELERPILQLFEDLLWPYYYVENGVPMP